jgi:hypothetical protein
MKLNELGSQSFRAFPKRLEAVVVVIVWYKTTACAISVYYHCCQFESRSWRGVFDTTLQFVSDLR